MKRKSKNFEKKKCMKSNEKKRNRKRVHTGTAKHRDQCPPNRVEEYRFVAHVGGIHSPVKFLTSATFAYVSYAKAVG